ncbi:MAG: hypothetical protein ACO3C1_00690 [Ilumatobacteraceae bacterium]
MHRLVASVDLRDRSVLRRVWGTGIGTVMALAVAPYPIAALFVDDEVPHRIHNVVGAVQYLPLWAVPVLMLTWGRDVAGATKIALAASCSMFAVGIWSGDLLPSLSWMPLATLLPIVVRRTDWTVHLSPWFAAAAAAAVVVASRHASTYVGYQRLGMADSHSLRFHFSGMAASYLTISSALVVCALFPVGATLRRVVAVTVLGTGITNVVWANSESALPRFDALLLVGAGVVSLAASGFLRRRGTERTADADVAATMPISR